MSDKSNGKSTSGAAIAGLILAIMAIILSWIPIINNFAFFLGLIGVILAIVGLVGTMRGKKSGKGIAIAAMVIGIISLVVTLGLQSMWSTAIDDAFDTSGVTSSEQNSSEEASSESSDESNSVEESVEEDYTISDVTATGNDYSMTITGTFTNNTDKTMSYVSLSYNLFDSDGAQIGTAYDNTSNLAAGGTWKFEALGIEALSNVSYYELVDVTCY